MDMIKVRIQKGLTEKQRKFILAHFGNPTFTTVEDIDNIQHYGVEIAPQNLDLYSSKEIRGTYKDEITNKDDYNKLMTLLVCMNNLLKNEGNDFLRGGIDINLSNSNMTVQSLIKFLEEIGYEMNENALDDYTNGWQVDFWLEFTRNGNFEGFPDNLTISGCMWTSELKLGLSFS